MKVFVEGFTSIVSFYMQARARILARPARVGFFLPCPWTRWIRSTPRLAVVFGQASEVGPWHWGGGGDEGCRCRT